MFMRLKLAIAIAAFALITSNSAAAGFIPKVSIDSTGRAVMINNRAAIRFHASNGSLSPAERARITAERLTRLAASKVDPKTIYLKADNQYARIMAGETLVCIVNADDARASKTTPTTLGSLWVRNIRNLLSMPAIVLSDKEIVVPLGENRRIYVSGAATGPISTASQNADIALASVSTDGRYVQVTGQKVGQTAVEIVVEGERALATVCVKKYAGFIGQIISAEVTGNPCPRHLLDYAAKQAILRNAVLESGASIKIHNIDGIDRPLQPGATREAKVDVSISGNGYITYAATPTVKIQNLSIPREEATQLFYSNNPERLLKYQTLFAGKLEQGKPVRILYHHQNAIGKRAKLIVEVINPGPTPAAFRVIKGVAGPMLDTVLVGYMAGGAFMRDELSNAGVIERVPPQSRLVLVSDTLGHNETSSGILQVNQIEGQSSYARVAALPPDAEEAQVNVGSITPAPAIFALELSDHVYPNPAKTLEASYVVGERWAFIPIGRHAITDSAAQKKLYGNYGVTYNINIKVENPTERPKKVSVLFEPSAGLASGVFIIDGEFVSAKYAKPPAEIPLASYQLKPGESRNVRIVTVPVAGSNYPATLVVRS